MNHYLKNLIKVLLSIKSEREMCDFLQAILTTQELEIIPKRLQIVKFMEKNVPQRTIAKKLGVGIATITRGSKELQINKEVWNKAINC